MFEIQTEGRLLKVKPIAGTLSVEDGSLVLDRVVAMDLAEQISQFRNQEPVELEDGEDG
jgi:hypothetical protein